MPTLIRIGSFHANRFVAKAFEIASLLRHGHIFSALVPLTSSDIASVAAKYLRLLNFLLPSSLFDTVELGVNVLVTFIA